MSTGVTAKNKNRKIRQEALREQLSNQGHVQHIVDIVDKLRDPSLEIESPMVGRYKIVIDTKLALIKKYIPDLKQVELTGDEDNPLHVAAREWVVKLEDAES